MNSLTSEADRNLVFGFISLTNAPVFRSKTAIPAVTPAGTTTRGVVVEFDGDGALEAGGDAASLVEGAAELGSWATVAGAFPPHALREASAASITSAA